MTSLNENETNNNSESYDTEDKSTSRISNEITEENMSSTLIEA